MADRKHFSLPPELAEVAARLEAEKPERPAELDRIRHRVKAGAEQRNRRHSQKGTFMRSRLALTAILALGLLFTFSGAFAVANDGFDHNDDAAHSQYRDDDDRRGGDHDFVTVGDGRGDGDGGGSVDSRGQGGAASGGLASTGFAAIPLFVIGFGLLGGGAALSLAGRK
jgi:hypothetical protein